MPDIQEAKCFEITVQIPPPPGAPRRGRAIHTHTPRFISVYALVIHNYICVTQTNSSFKV